MKDTVTLDGKDVRRIIARFLRIPEEQVIPLRYNFNVNGMSAAEIERKISGAALRFDDEKSRSGLLTEE